MARYYEEAALIEFVKRYTPYINGETTMICVERAIREAPTADVVEAKPAHWEINPDGYYPYCSNCKTEPKGGEMTDHCPKCGAYMKGATNAN